MFEKMAGGTYHKYTVIQSVFTIEKYLSDTTQKH